MNLDKHCAKYPVVGQVRELIRDREHLQAICRLVAGYPDVDSDAVLADAMRDIANALADAALNPETDA